MTNRPRITVAPNGARRQKSDHPALPITTAEVAETARACHAAGADALHLHVREADGAHSLDTGLYTEALAAVDAAVPGISVQITTESAGIFDVPAQLHLIETLRPKAASVAVREIFRAPDLAVRTYATLADIGTEVQHILYGPGCLQQLNAWLDDGTVLQHQKDAILVLGQYNPPVNGAPGDLDAVLPDAAGLGLTMTVCAFGGAEEACLIAAAERGCDLRIGFENNLHAPDGTLWADNAAAVASLVAALERNSAR